MLCCRDHNDDYFDENDIDENYYLHFDLLQSSLLRNIDLKNIIDEIVFNTTEQFIRLKVFKEILKKYTLHSDKIIEILVSAFFILPTKNIINESYENYLKFNIQFIILNEIEFNKYIEFINKSTNFNSKNKEFIQDSKLNSMYIIFFLISFSEFNEINNVIKIKVIFSMLDGHSKKFIRRDENEVEEILTKYVEFCLFITDIVSNFFLESKSKKVATFKKQFIAYKTHLLFLKEFANLFDQFVEYIIDNLIFTKQQSNQKIYYNVNNLYNDSLEPSNIFGYIFKMNNYALFKPMEIRNRLTEFLKLKYSVLYKIFVNEMQIMINYYWVLYMDNVEIPRITKNINIFTKYNYLSHIQDFESRIISPKSNFEFLFKDNSYIQSNNK